MAAIARLSDLHILQSKMTMEVEHEALEDGIHIQNGNHSTSMAV